MRARYPQFDLGDLTFQVRDLSLQLDQVEFGGRSPRHQRLGYGLLLAGEPQRPRQIVCFRLQFDDFALTLRDLILDYRNLSAKLYLPRLIKRFLVIYQSGCLVQNLFRKHQRFVEGLGFEARDVRLEGQILLAAVLIVGIGLCVRDPQQKPVLLDRLAVRDEHLR